MQQHADLVFSGGPVFTATTQRTRATAVAVTGGRIVAVGHDEVRELIGPRTEHVDLAGRMLVPGFQDAHAHPVWGGLDLMRCNLAEVFGTPQLYLDMIAEYAAARPDDEWVLGGGWTMSAFPGGTPLAADLDRVVPDRPAFLPNRDGHGAWVNSVALRLAGIDKHTPDPADGRIERDADGNPSGTLHEGAMSLVNVAYASRLTWANNLLSRIEDQALIPLFSEHPVEMGMNGRDGEIAALLREDPLYRTQVPEVFPRDEDPYSVLNTVNAIAAFVRSIVSFDSPYDAFLRGDTDALSPAAQRGMELFFSERFECFHCHGGFNFTDSSTHQDATIESVGFHNNGLYNLDGDGAYPPDNTGLIDLTGQRRDMGRFKAPSLRNVAVTAPYMHDGSLATLEDVIDHYAAGGSLVEDGPLAGDGRRNPFKSEFVRGFEMTQDERADLLAFLRSLTDERVLTDERWSDPF